MSAPKYQRGTRVRVKRKHAYGEGDGRWGSVTERRGRKHIMVHFDDAKKPTLEHVANVVEVFQIPSKRLVDG